MAWKPLDAQRVCGLYQAFWPGKVTERLIDLFAARLRGFHAVDVERVLEDLAVWESSKRPQIGRVVDAVAEYVSKRREREPGLDEQDDAGEIITGREWLGRVDAEVYLPRGIPELRETPTPADIRKGIEYLRSVLGNAYVE
jgi:hypothetical protein